MNPEVNMQNYEVAKDVYQITFLGDDLIVISRMTDDGERVYFHYNVYRLKKPKERQ